MANLTHNQTFKCMCTTMFIILFLLSYTTCSSSHSSSTQDIQPQNQNPSLTTTNTHYHQVFYLKNRDSSISLTKQERFKKRRNIIKRNKNMKKHRNKILKNNMMMQSSSSSSSRTFSAMLPKGFVPPSGSSPCHNDQPNSVSSFHCHLSSTSAKP